MQEGYRERERETNPTLILAVILAISSKQHETPQPFNEEESRHFMGSYLTAKCSKVLLNYLLLRMCCLQSFVLNLTGSSCFANIFIFRKITESLVLAFECLSMTFCVKTGKFDFVRKSREMTEKMRNFHK